MLEHLMDFIGRTHLVLLHFPIALILAAAGVEVCRMLTPKLRREPAALYRPGPAGTLMFALGSLGVLASVVTGLVLGFDGGTRVDLHRILGILSGVAVLVTGALLLRTQLPRSIGPSHRGGVIYLVMLCVSAALIGITGHFGGELTHGSGFLTKPLKRMIGIEPEIINGENLQEISQEFGLSMPTIETFNASVLPIFKRSCIECHGPDEAEDDIRLDSLGYVLDPDADMVHRGDPDGSELVYRITLPHGDPDIMPPEEDGEPLTGAEITVIRDWIASLGDE